MASMRTAGPSLLVVPAGLAATPVPDGFAVFITDDTSRVHGSLLRLVDGTLQVAVRDREIADKAHGAPAVVAIDDNLLVATTYGGDAPVGTQLVALDEELMPRIASPVERDQCFSDNGMMAPLASGNVGLLAKFPLSETETEFSATVVTPLGVEQRPNATLIDKLEKPDLATLIPTGDGFAAVWVTRQLSPHQVRAAIFGADFTPLTAPSTISHDLVHEALWPRGAYSPSLERYLFAWAQKYTGPGDQIWATLRTKDMLPDGAPIQIAARGFRPVIAAGKDDFLVVWVNDTLPPPSMGAARVSSKGVVTPVEIKNQGGASLAWTVVVLDGQPALIWIEDGADEDTLRVDPLCEP